MQVIIYDPNSSDGDGTKRFIDCACAAKKRPYCLTHSSSFLLLYVGQAQWSFVLSIRADA